MPPTRPPTGRLRTAVLADAPLAAEWIDAFRRDAAIGSPAPADEVARRRIEEGSLWLWEDGGEPVSLCAFAGPTPHGIRINCVYTPPERRARGYASAAVAAFDARRSSAGG